MNPAIAELPRVGEEGESAKNQDRRTLEDLFLDLRYMGKADHRGTKQLIKRESGHLAIQTLWAAQSEVNHLSGNEYIKRENELTELKSRVNHRLVIPAMLDLISYNSVLSASEGGANLSEKIREGIATNILGVDFDKPFTKNLADFLYSAAPEFPDQREEMMGISAEYFRFELEKRISTVNAAVGNYDRRHLCFIGKGLKQALPDDDKALKQNIYSDEIREAVAYLISNRHKAGSAGDGAKTKGNVDRSLDLYLKAMDPDAADLDLESGECEKFKAHSVALLGMADQEKNQVEYTPHVSVGDVEYSKATNIEDNLYASSVTTGGKLFHIRYEVTTERKVCIKHVCRVGF